MLSKKAIFEKLKYLKKDMESKGWWIDSFLFSYNEQDFIVLVNRYEINEKKPDYALLKIEFLKRKNLDDNLEVHANSIKLMIDAKTLRKYFNIQYTENLGDILGQFNIFFAMFIPIEVIVNKSTIEKSTMVRSLSKSDSENPNKIYCFKVKRNPYRIDGTLGQRSPYNDNKTRILRPSLYQKLSRDTNLSFCFSEKLCDENSDETIIYNWTKNKIKNSK